MPPGLVYEKTDKPCQIVQWEGVCSRARTRMASSLQLTGRSGHGLIGQSVVPLTRPGIARMGAGKAILRYQLVRTKILKRRWGTVPVR
jgi:hypothetical protein